MLLNTKKKSRNNKALYICLIFKQIEENIVTNNEFIQLVTIVYSSKA